MKKRILSVLLCGMVSLSMAACGSKNEESVDAEEPVIETEAPTPEATETVATPEIEEKTIAELQNGDVFVTGELGSARELFCAVLDSENENLESLSALVWENVEQVSDISFFDINLLDENGNEVQPGGTVAVALPLNGGTGENEDASENENIEYKAAYLDLENHTYEELDSTVNEGKICFETTHFSLYAVIKVDKSIEVSDQETSATGAGSSSEVTSSQTGSSSEPGSSSANTSQSTSTPAPEQSSSSSTPSSNPSGQGVSQGSTGTTSFGTTYPIISEFNKNGLNASAASFWSYDSLNDFEYTAREANEALGKAVGSLEARGVAFTLDGTGNIISCGSTWIERQCDRGQYLFVYGCDLTALADGGAMEREIAKVMLGTSVTSTPVEVEKAIFEDCFAGNEILDDWTKIGDCLVKYGGSENDCFYYMIKAAN